jgi:hypothetical protein
VETITTKNFGLVIAFLLPGFIALCGLSFQSSIIRTWIIGGGATTPVTVGGFLYSTLAALVVGLLCSTIRWLCLDTLHHRTGIRRPHWDYTRLQENLGAYTLFEENHYRYYQFYGNSLVAWIIGYGAWRLAETRGLWSWSDILLVAAGALLFLGSRDTLRKYYQRVRVLLSSKSGKMLVIASARHRERSY